MKRFEADGIEYNIGDLAEEVGIDKERAELLLSQGNTISPAQFVALSVLAQVVRRGLSAEDDTALVDAEDLVLHFEEIAPADAVAPDEEINRAEELFRLYSVLRDELSERERWLLTRFYDFEDGEFRTLSEVGKEMGLSRERVRQIRQELLDRLRDAYQRS
jgi:RNA polymerase sigma factor (sigma-70 family)